MKQFKPTWLYVKQHNKTGLKYFGKTTRPDPIKYKGSGLYWSRHLKKYGNDTTTLWTLLFTNESELSEYALDFSIKYNVVESDEWANLKHENGLDGGNDIGHLAGRKFTPEHREKLSESAKKRKPLSEETRRKMSEAKKGVSKSNEWKQSASRNRKGKTPWNKGASHTDEAKQKMSISSSGEKNPMYGKSHTEESRKKMSDARVGKSPSNKGKPLSEEQKLRQSEKMRGKTPWNKGVSMKQEYCKVCGKFTTVAALGRYHKH